MENGLKILAINHVGESEEDNGRIAISPGSVKMLASKDTKRHGRDLKEVTIFFVDSEHFTFVISNFELQNLENVVAGYSEAF